MAASPSRRRVLAIGEAAPGPVTCWRASTRLAIPMRFELEFRATSFNLWIPNEQILDPKFY